MKTEELTAAELALCRRDDLKTTATGWVVFAAALLLILTVGILGWQAYQWLKFGYWPHLTWATGFQYLGLGYPDTSAIGAQRIIDWIMSAGLWTLPLSIVFVGVWGWFTYADHKTPAADAALNKRAAWKRHKAWQEAQKG